MRIIYVKIGTMPGDVMGLLYKRKPVKVGEWVWLRHLDNNRKPTTGERDIRVCLTGINEEGRHFFSR